jgi:hypothetical protein
MKYGPPGMDNARWALYLKEQARALGHRMEFTADEIATLEREARQIDDACTTDEIRGMFS